MSTTNKNIAYYLFSSPINSSLKPSSSENNLNSNIESPHFESITT